MSRRRAIERGIGAIILFAALARAATRLWAITAVEISLLVLVFLWFWNMNNERSWHFKRTPLDIPILLFLAFASVSCIFSIYSHDSLAAMGRLLILIGIYYVTVNKIHEKSGERLMTLTVILGAVLSVYGLGQYFFDIPHSWWADGRFISSTYINHNHFAGYLEMVIPVAIGLLIGSKDITRRFLLAFACIIMAAAFLLAQSRGAWISLILSFSIALIYMLRRGIIKKDIFILTAAVLLIFLAIFNAGEDAISTRVATLGDTKGDPSLTSRVKMWNGTVDMILARPLTGSGIGTFFWGFQRYRPIGLNAKVDQAHNDYLDIAAEMGVLSLAMVFWIIFVILKKSASLIKIPAYAGVAIGLLSIFIHSLFDFNLHIPANAIIVSMFSALVMGYNKDIHGT